MTSSSITFRPPWQNRWTRPTLGQLLKPLTAQHRELLELIMAHVDDLGEADQQITWYDTAWNWTIQYNLRQPESNHSQTLCYLIPDIEAPVVCVPLSDAVIKQLPLRRLSRIIRDGIQLAKCAFQIHWAVWTPNNPAEVDHLLDLLKRKHKLTVKPVARR